AARVASSIKAMPFASRSNLRPPDSYFFGDPDVALAGAHRGFLASLAADPGLHREVLADRVDRSQRLQAVADQRCAPAGPRHLPALDQVALRDAEDEVAGGGVHLPTAEGGRVEAALDLGDDLIGRGIAG